VTTPLQYRHPDGTTRPSCPECGDPMTRAVGGIICLSCLASVAVPSVPGPHVLPPLPDIVVPPPPPRWPYRTGMHAIQALILSRQLAESARSVTGAQLEMLALGLLPAGTRCAPQSMPAVLDPIGDLAAAWDELLGEDRLLLEASVKVPDWHDAAMRCRDCEAVYPPAGRRCYRCQGRRDFAAVKCLRCGDTRGVPEWDPCPRCGSRRRAHVDAKAEQLALLAEEWRRASFERFVGRPPHAGEERVVTYCPACGLWSRRDRHCGRDTRHGLSVSARQIGGMLRGAIYQWERILIGRGLMGKPKNQRKAGSHDTV